MKIIVLIFTLLEVSVFSCFSATWTIHVWKDNYNYIAMYGDFTNVECNGTVTGAASYITEVYWDYAGDIAYPQWAYSGARSGVLQCGGWNDTTLISGWNENYSFTYGEGTIGLGGVITSGGSGLVEFSQWFISGGFPNYGGGTVFPEPQEGEWWIDYNSDGTVRVSPIALSDFGKWSWDGSINPNYVEPTAPLKSTRGKHLGKQVK